MSTTLLPFLYHTRTLRQLSKTGLRIPALHALLHSTLTSNSPRGRSRPNGRKPDAIPFELPEGYEDLQSDTKADSMTDAEAGTPRSTITPAEHETFSKIFKEIASKNNSRASTTAATPDNLFEEVSAPPSSTQNPPNFGGFDQFSGLDRFDDFNPQHGGSESSRFRDAVNIIVEDAVTVPTRSGRIQGYHFSHIGNKDLSPERWQKALERFPPSLREAARMALNVIESDRVANQSTPGVAGQNGELAKSPRSVAEFHSSLDSYTEDEVERRAERRRVETRMCEAKTDFELWDVLEDEVFPIAKKIADPSLKRKVRRPKRTNADERDEKHHMRIYGPLYGVFLLRALQLFDTQFARTSPMALNLLPRIKELGPASYVLGVGTPFYNELASILWRRYGDPEAVFNTFEEMRHAGLYCNRRTGDIVDEIENSMAPARSGDKGPFLKEILSFPEYEYAVWPRVRYWKNAVMLHMKRQQRGDHGNAIPYA